MYDSMTRHMTKDYRSMTLLVDVVETLNPWEKTQGNNWYFLDLEVILGMNWLSTHDNIIHCVHEQLIFLRLQRERMLCARQFLQDMLDDVECFILL